MLIDFKITNYRSLKDEQTLSMLAASSIKEHRETHLINTLGTLNLLRTALIFGPNASGKTNLLDAIDTLRWLILAARRFDESDTIDPMHPFRLNSETTNQPCSFNINFISLNIRYEYKIESNNKLILKEELNFFPDQSKKNLFKRNNSIIELGPSLRTQTAEKLVTLGSRRTNTPFLSLLGQFEEPYAIDAYRWFSDRLRTIISPRLSANYSKRLLLEDEDARSFITNLLCRGDFGIHSIEATKESHIIPDELLRIIGDKMITDENKQAETIKAHFKHSSNPSIVFEESDESRGTLQLLKLAGPLYDVFKNGRILVIDELDASLHPDLVRSLVHLFNSPTFNPHGAQLIANTHDVSQLNSRYLRRDNIWFTEKNNLGESNLYSLADFKGIRNNTAFQKNYLQGRFGAIPALGFSQFFFPSSSQSSDEQE